MSFTATSRRQHNDRSAACVAAQQGTCLHPIQICDEGKRIVVGTVREEIPPALDLEEDRRALESFIVEHGTQELAFDLSDLRFFSSSFLSLLVWFTRRNVQVVVLHPPEHLIRVLETTRLNELIRVVDTADETSAAHC